MQGQTGSLGPSSGRCDLVRGDASAPVSTQRGWGALRVPPEEQGQNLGPLIPHPTNSCPILCLGFPTRALQPQDRQGWVCRPSPRHMCAHVSLGVHTGSAHTPTPPCGTMSPRDPPQAPLGCRGGTFLYPSPATRSRFLAAGLGGLSSSGSQREPPPFTPPASGLLSFASGCCQEAAGCFPLHPQCRAQPPQPLPGELA